MITNKTISSLWDNVDQITFIKNVAKIYELVWFFRKEYEIYYNTFLFRHNYCLCFVSSVCCFHF